MHLTKKDLQQINRVYMVACGSAYHTCMVGKYIMEKLARIPVEADLASEFRYRDPIVDEHTLVIIVSQSGETAVYPCRPAGSKRRGARRRLSRGGRTIASEATMCCIPGRDREISVATTKVYSTQLTILYLLAFYFAHKLGHIDDRDLRRLLSALIRLPDMVAGILRQAPDIQQLAQRYAYLITPISSAATSIMRWR